MIENQIQKSEDEVAEYLGLTSADYGSTEHEYEERGGYDVVVFTSISDELKAKIKNYNLAENYALVDWNKIKSAKETNE